MPVCVLLDDVGRGLPRIVLHSDRHRVPLATDVGTALTIVVTVRSDCLRRHGSGHLAGGRGHTLFRVDAFAGVAGDVAVLEAAGERLVKRGQIIHRAFAVLASDGEASVFGFLGDRVFEHHHGGHLEGTAHSVRNVVAFDAQRGFRESQCLGHIVHGLGACAHVGDAAHLAALQCLAGVLVGAVHKLLLVASRGHTDGHRSPAQIGQPAFEFLTAGRFDGHDDFARYRCDGCQQVRAPGGLLTGVAFSGGLGACHSVRGRDGLRGADGLAISGDGRGRLGVIVPGGVRIHLHQKVGHQVGVIDVLNSFDAPVAFAANRAGAHIKSVHGGFELVAGEAEHVRVHILVEDDGVLLHHGFQHLDLVAQSGGFLEFEFGAGLFHVAGQLGDVWPSESSGHHADQLFAQPPVFVRFNAVHAGCGAFADGSEQAWPSGQLRLMEHVGGAGAYRERAQQPVKTVPQFPHFGIGAEIPGIPPFARPRDPHARNSLPRADREIRIGLVVAELHVEPWVEFLDPRVFQRQ